MCRIVIPGPEPEDRQQQTVGRIGESEPHRAGAGDVAHMNRHDCHGKHLREREDADTDIVRRVQVVVERSVDPRRPHRVEDEQEPADTRPRRMLRQTMRHLSDNNHKTRSKNSSRNVTRRSPRRSSNLLEAARDA